MSEQDDKCYACGRGFRRSDTRRFAVTSDGFTVYVGSDCHRHICSARGAGFQPPRGGPRLFKPSPQTCAHEWETHRLRDESWQACIHCRVSRDDAEESP